MLIKINRAIPQRRYRLGGFEVVILGEIESPDPTQYHYLLAVIPDGEAQPVLYISCEQSTEGSERGQYFIRVTSDAGEKLLGPVAQWQYLESFVTDALLMVRKVMNLMDEEPMRIL